MSDPIVIVSAARTPIGGMLGDFASLQAGRRAAAVGRRGDAVEDVRLGHARHDVRARHACGR